MSQTEVTRIPKPEADSYEGKHKLILVPIFLLSPQAPEDGLKILERYWSEVRDQVGSLERSFGQVAHVFHEAVFEGGEDGLKSIEYINPYAQSFIQSLCRSTAQMEATEDRALMEEASDWQSCISLGLSSVKVMDVAVKGYRDATDGRFAHIQGRIDSTLGTDGTGALFIREDHKVQFPDDVQVFYVAPRAMDDLKRWINDQVNLAVQRVNEVQEAEEAGESDGPESDNGNGGEGSALS